LAGYQFRATAFYKFRNERAVLRRLREPRSRDVSIKKTRGRLAASIRRRKYKRRAGSPVTGGLDVYGCHNNRRAGGYHCHRGPLAGQSFSSKEEMLKKLSAENTDRKVQTDVKK
jgi:hypothetical protein